MKTLLLFGVGLLIGFAVGKVLEITQVERDWARMQRDAALRQLEIRLFQPNMRGGPLQMPEGWNSTLHYVTNQPILRHP